MDKVRQVTVMLGFLVLLCLVSITVCFPATAVLRQHHETSGVLRYHVHSSLQDKQGMTWQVIIFPEEQSKTVTKYHP